jgi:alcohol dehydrogenase
MMMIAPFAIARLPRIEFGAGRITRLPAIAAGYGQRLLLVTGGRSLRATPQWDALLLALRAARIETSVIQIAGEPSPDEIDAIIRGDELPPADRKQNDAPAT